MQKQCKQCGKGFEATRDTATYCGATCRSKARVSVQKVSVQDDNKVSVQSGLCKNCKTPVRHNVDICRECVLKGITRKQLNLPDIERVAFTDSPIKQMNWQRNKMTYKEAIERMIYSMAEIGCDCIVGNKIYQSKRVIKADIS